MLTRLYRVEQVPLSDSITRTQQALQNSLHDAQGRDFRCES